MSLVADLCVPSEKDLRRSGMIVISAGDPDFIKSCVCRTQIPSIYLTWKEKTSCAPFLYLHETD